jgi:uncharacterized membrane protein YciS (DUF1049 family)
MSTEQLSVIIGTFIGLMVIPWCAWVTTSIFNLRTQTTLFKAELEAVKRIEAAVEHLRKN